MRACPCCGEYAPTLLYDLRLRLPEGWRLPEAYPFVRCDCEMVYVDVDASQADYDRYYATQYTNVAGGVCDTPLDDRRLLRTARQLNKWIRPSDRVLDVGGGSGGLKRHLRDLCGVTTEVLDPAFPDPHRGTVTSLPAGMGSFDIVVLSHVMEHIFDVDQAVANVVALTRPGGKVYVEVPDCLRIATRGGAPFVEFNHKHINMFTPGTLARMFPALELVETEEGVTDGFPVVHAVFERTDDASEFGKYVARSAARRTVLPKHPVIVWGVGDSTMRLLGEGRLTNAIYFVDSNPIFAGETIMGKPVKQAPDSADDILVISPNFADEILHDIGRRGYANKVTVLDL